ncbi:hypothetical protein [Streptomyces sp. NPDC002758]
MARHAYIRLRLLVASAVLSAGLAPLLPSTAVADVPQETVVPATLRSTYTSATLQTPSSYNGHDGAAPRVSSTPWRAPPGSSGRGTRTASPCP